MAQQNTRNGVVLSGSGQLQNWGDYVTMVGGNSDDEIYNQGSNVIINAGAGNDTVYNNGAYTFISADAGNNFIQHQQGAGCTLAGGAGNDTLISLAPGAIMVGGSGRASINLTDAAINSTVTTSNGRDTVTMFSTGTTVFNLNSNQTLIKICADAQLVVNADGQGDCSYEYYNGAHANATLTSVGGQNTLRAVSGDNLFRYVGGQTVLVGFSGNDTLAVINSGVDRARINGDDVVLTIGSGSITIKNAKGRMVRITDNRGPRVKTIGGHYTYSPQDVIKKFMSALDQTTARGAAAVDDAIKACSTFNGTTDLINQLVSDAQRSKDARTFLADKCGIDLYNDDTGAITGWDAGGNVIKTATSIVDERTAEENFIGNSFVVEGLTVKLNADFNSLPAAQQKIVRGLKSWWVAEPLRLIEESYGEIYSFKNRSATVRELDVEFLSRPNNSNLALIKNSSLNGRTVKLTLQINMAYYDQITDVDGRSARRGTSYLDRVLAHEFTHAVMAANILNFGDLPAYVKEGTAELTHGIDDERQIDLVKMVEQPTVLRGALSAATSTAEVSFSGLNAPSYAAGYIFFRYLAKQAANFMLNY